MKMNSMIELFRVMQSNWGFYLQRSLSTQEEMFLERWCDCVLSVDHFENYNDAFEMLLRDYNLFLKLSNE